LIPIQPGLKVSDFIQSHTVGDPRREICDQLMQSGYEVPKQLTIGKLTRIDGPDDKPGKKSGWLIYHELDDCQIDGAVFGIANWGSWKTGEKHSWSSKQAKHMTTAERVSFNAQVEAQRLAVDQEQRQVHEDCATEAQREWPLYPDADHDNAYLAGKKLAAIGDVKQDNGRGGCLLVPVLIDGVMRGYQRIWPDRKRFKTGTQKKGGYFCIKGNDSRVFIAEGYATAASVHLATGNTCYVSFDAGNLYNVAQTVKASKTSSIVVIAADNDHGKGANTGVNAAQQIKDGLGIDFIIPQGGFNDFDDWRQAEGLDPITAYLKTNTAKKYEVKEKTSAPENPKGVLGDIIGFYNATSGNDQPLFAVQAAIATASIILGRSFCTRTGIYPMLYLMNVGETGTGKEHAKKIVEQVLSESGNEGLIGGDGYTSGAAVLSALIARPRHLTIIDEFGRYLEVAQNKNDSIAKTANTELMQVFGRPDGTQRAKNYSLITATKDARDAMSKLFIHNPHITLLAMSTPDRLFNSLGVESIDDGFLNRFLVCVSDAKKDIRRHKERMPVPKSILDWCDAIRDRNKNKQDVPTDKPELVEISFTHEANQMQEDFQRYWLDRDAGLKKVGLSNITNRANEIALRLSLVYALAVNPHATIIEADHLQWAIDWTKYNFNRLIDELKMCVSGSEFESQKKAALKAIRSAHDGISFAKMQKTPPFSRYKRRELQDILLALKDAQLVDSEMRAGGVGRPSETYFAIEVE